MSLNAEGYFLLRIVVSRIAGIDELLAAGDCKAVATVVNQSMPESMQISPADIHWAFKDAPTYRSTTMNVAILRARIDANPLLYSARISGGDGGHQAILNELVKDKEIVPPPTIADVKAAMALRAVPKPERTARGAAALTGVAGM